jgi:GNAT superfamily N-acetyltransferase
MPEVKSTNERSGQPSGAANGIGVRVVMTRDHLENIPEYSLPEGFSFRWHQSGDEKHWMDIHYAAYRGEDIPADLFAQKFGSHPHELARRQCYLISPDGGVIGTASAWFDDNFEGRPAGRIHYIAILPEHHGKGLSKPLLSLTCNRLRELGHERAYLVTATARARAIGIYFQYGFKPFPRTAEEAKAWAEFVRPARQ